MVVQVAPVAANASTASIESLATATPSVGVQLLNASPKECQCQCLCPASAFLAYGSMVAPPVISMSTFQTVTSVVTAGQPNPSFVISASSPPANLIANPAVSPPSSASSSELPGVTSISQNTNSLMDGITVALNVRDSKPTSILQQR